MVHFPAAKEKNYTGLLILYRAVVLHSLSAAVIRKHVLEVSIPFLPLSLLVTVIGVCRKRGSAFQFARGTRGTILG